MLTEAARQDHNALIQFTRDLVRIPSLFGQEGKIAVAQNLLATRGLTPRPPLLTTALPSSGEGGKGGEAFPRCSIATFALLRKITATVEVIRLRPEKELENLHTVCQNGAGNFVCEGAVLGLVRDVNPSLRARGSR